MRLSVTEDSRPESLAPWLQLPTDGGRLACITAGSRDLGRAVRGLWTGGEVRVEAEPSLPAPGLMKGRR